MEIRITVKQLGKKHPLLSEQTLEIAYNHPNITL
ncbi:hypothetical protein BCF50_1805 [Chryseobacterium daecheongense]|uniref:Uncharacterized protein n=1 Tax=Chryseobacterium daecheongense TaxID=192389 RepID=A0ABY2FV60_9FLAO|nr:hypothetical protein BCF50_1805 [Chryseobacterium daecheongense]